MVDYGIYAGADYSLDPKYSDSSNSPFTGYRLPAGAFSFPSNPTTANQVDAVSKKISTGSKNVEVSGVNVTGQPGELGLLDNLPKTHLKEIKRIAKITGTDLTFHAPLVEPTGINPQSQQWDESDRIQAERMIASSVERAHEMDPKGNIVVVFHASNGLPDPRSKMKMADGSEVSTDLVVVDERTGRWGRMDLKSTTDYLEGKNRRDIDQELKERNKRAWTTNLSNMSISLTRARQEISQAQAIDKDVAEVSKKEGVPGLYNLSITKPDEYKEAIKGMAKINPTIANVVQHKVADLAYADAFVRDSYQTFKEAFNEAYFQAERSEDKPTLKKLDEYAKNIKKINEDYQGDRSKLVNLTGEIEGGIRMLQSLKEPPAVFKPIEQFAIEKASKTFANAAYSAYSQWGDEAPVIAIENPPVGMGLSRATEIEKLVKETRKKFVEKAKEEGVSEEKAEKDAEKLIGVTWDVGHINMLRKHGYSTKDILEQTKKISPYVKHIHLSDNFGLEHTELPMGMGNVPIKEHEEILRKQFKEKFSELKQVVETGAWFRNFNNVTPFAETLQAFGSSIYPMKSSYWNATRSVPGGYFAGYGQMLPEQHFSVYGAGFSNLPPELGGQMSGRSRMSGTPTE